MSWTQTCFGLGYMLGENNKLLSNGAAKNYLTKLGEGGVALGVYTRSIRMADAKTTCA